MMHAPSSRCGVLAAPIVAAGCGRRSPYFGSTTPPKRRVLKFGCIAAWGEVGGFEDPTWFLDIFTSPTASGTGWSEPHYEALLTAAKTEIDPPARMRKLAECERLLLESMPCLPLCDDVWSYLCKPFVKGMGSDPFHFRVFNDLWIDTNWRPQ